MGTWRWTRYGVEVRARTLTIWGGSLIVVVGSGTTCWRAIGVHDTTYGMLGGR